MTRLELAIDHFTRSVGRAPDGAYVHVSRVTETGDLLHPLPVRAREGLRPGDLVLVAHVPPNLRTVGQPAAVRQVTYDGYLDPEPPPRSHLKHKKIARPGERKLNAKLGPPMPAPHADPERKGYCSCGAKILNGHHCENGHMMIRA